MALPSKHISKARTRSRAAHHGLSKKQLIECQSCHRMILPHHACSYCGKYKGK
ncbi:MAG: 50S ribosomal protein L32 [Parcubacteria group bacterium]|nr:50S ribosomal protein L32 [Parcubacteria group bacterium]